MSLDTLRQSAPHKHESAVQCPEWTSPICALWFADCLWQRVSPRKNSRSPLSVSTRFWCQNSASTSMWIQTTWVAGWAIFFVFRTNVMIWINFQKEKQLNHDKIKQGFRATSMCFGRLWAFSFFFFFFLRPSEGASKVCTLILVTTFFILAKPLPPNSIRTKRDHTHTYLHYEVHQTQLFFFFVIVDQVDGYISKEKTELMITNFYAVLKILKRQKKSHFLEDNEVESSSIRSASVKDMSSFRLKKKSRRSKQYSVW